MHLDLSSTGLTNDSLIELQQLLNKFSRLELLSLAFNPNLTLLPIGMQMLCSNLVSFDSFGCSLLWPPQSDLNSSQSHSQVIYNFMDSKEISLHKRIVQPIDVSIITDAMPHFSCLSKLDISNNPELGDTGVLAILSALTGWCTCCQTSLIYYFHYLLCSVASSTAYSCRFEFHWLDAGVYAAFLYTDSAFSRCPGAQLNGQ
jgi:hypothetical protein